MRFVVAATLALAFCLPARAQDFAEPATYGDIVLERGFAPNPHTIELSAGGAEEAGGLGRGCVGKIANAPDLQLDWRAGGALTLAVSSDADTSLVVNSPDGSWLCDDDSGGGQDARLVLRSADAGIYDIWVGVVDSAAYPDATLSISGDAAAQSAGRGAATRNTNPPPSVGGDRIERGKLESGDATYRNGEYRDRYVFNGRRGQNVIFDLRSTDFDPYLVVRSPAGVDQVNDDFEGSTERSVLNLTLAEDGDHEIIVTSYAARESGAYSLAIQPRAAVQGPPTERYEGALERGDERRDGGEYYDAYELRGTAGARVTIELESDAFDPYLVLVAPSGAIEENDDHGESVDSLIETTLAETGTYRVRASSYERGETGDYTLRIVQGAAPSPAEQARRDTVDLVLGQPANGRLERGDQQPEPGRYQDVYAFAGTAGQAIRVDLTSADFDTFVAVRAPDGTVIDNDDFEGSLRRSAVDLTLRESGRYQVIVHSYDREETGTYRLLASIASAAGVASTPAPRGSAQPANRDGTVYGIFTGIGDYGGRMGDLEFTAEDPVAVRDALMAHAGMRPSDAITLVDNRATTTAVRDAFRTMAGRVGPNDVFVFFYSGHGGQVDRAGGPDTVDADGMDETLELYDDALLDDELRALLVGIRGRALIILDSCFSGGFSKDLVSAPGRMGLFSSEEDVTSFVADKFRAGGYLAAFFKEAVENGRADTDDDSAINAVELSQYLHERYRGEAQQKSAARYVDAPDFGYQHLVVDRGGIRPYDVLFRLGR